MIGLPHFQVQPGENMLKNKNYRNLVIIPLFVSLLTGTPAVFAGNYEITPLLGYRFSESMLDENTGENIDLEDTSSVGLILSLKKDHSTNYDFLFSRQDTNLRSSSTAANGKDLRIDYFQLGGTVDYSSGNLHPFATGGIGITRVKASSSETNFSLNLGGGFRIPVSENVGLRLEGRVYVTAFNGSGSIICSGGCVVKVSGSTYLQFETNAGLYIKF